MGCFGVHVGMQVRRQRVPAEQGTQLEQGRSAGAKGVAGQRGGGGERTETAVKRTAC